MTTDYKVKLEIFEGPLDLLLYLIKRDEIDIYDISIERITRQYLEYLDAFKELNIDVAGEFIVMANVELSIAPRRKKPRLRCGGAGVLPVGPVGILPSDSGTKVCGDQWIQAARLPRQHFTTALILFPHLRRLRFHLPSPSLPAILDAAF